MKNYIFFNNKYIKNFFLYRQKLLSRKCKDEKKSDEKKDKKKKKEKKEEKNSENKTEKKEGKMGDKGKSLELLQMIFLDVLLP